MSLQKIALTALAALFLMTCHSSEGILPSPVTTQCDASFGGDWRWVIQSSCSPGVNTGLSAATFDQSTCKVTFDVTSDTQRKAGLTMTLEVNFGTGKARLTRSGGCDGVDEGTITHHEQNQWELQMTPAKVGNCCTADYYINISH